MPSKFAEATPAERTACIDNRRTIVSRRPDRPQGDRLFFFAHGGDVSFEDVTVAPLA
jgi:hypothetical protein